MDNNIYVNLSPEGLYIYQLKYTQYFLILCINSIWLHIRITIPQYVNALITIITALCAFNVG